METDYFNSSTTSTVLSWILAIPIFLSIIGYGLSILLKKYGEIPRLYMLWVILCIVMLSPCRYLLLQAIAASNYLVQSWYAFFSSILLGIYVPLVFGILYAIGINLPLILPLWITGLLKSETFSKVKLFIAGLLVPVFCLLGSYLFSLVLPIAGITTHWLKAKDVIKASNGPAWFYYQYACTWLMPIDAPLYGAKPDDTKSLYRNHIASVYLSEKQNMQFLKHAYPEYYETLPNRTYSNTDHFKRSIGFANEAARLNNQREAYSVATDEETKKWIELYQKALAEAKLVDIDQLNLDHPNFGNHFRDEYLWALQLLIKGYDINDNQYFIQGQRLLDKWADWYSANLPNIKEGNKVEVK